MELKNKRVLVTGSTDGLGKLLAIAMLKRGANVILHGRNEEKVASLVQILKEQNLSISEKPIVCDLINSQAIQEVFSTISGSLDILINNAGVWLEGDTIDTTPEKIIEQTHVNLLAPMLITRILLPNLFKSEFGQIVNIASIAGVEIPAGYFHTIYSGVKFGLQGFTEALAKEFDNRNMRVMGYYPGGMETDLFKKSGIDYEKHELWMFDPQESVEAIIFMLTRNKKVNVKRLDLINQLQE